VSIVLCSLGVTGPTQGAQCAGRHLNELEQDLMNKQCTMIVLPTVQLLEDEAEEIMAVKVRLSSKHS